MGGMKERIARPLHEVRDLGRRLAELNIELLKAELKRATARYGAAVGLFVAAAVIAVFGVGFLLATIAVALNIVLPLWAAMAVVTGLIFLLVAVLALVGKQLVTSAKSPSAGSAMTEARVSVQAVKAGAQSVARRGRKVTPEATAEGPAADAAEQPPPAGAPAFATPSAPVAAGQPAPQAPEQPTTPAPGGDDAPD